MLIKFLVHVQEPVTAYEILDLFRETNLKPNKMILEAYCLKTKTKEAFVNPVISQTAKGGYICKGESKDGHKMSLLMSKVTAEAAVAAGVKKEGW